MRVRTFSPASETETARHLELQRRFEAFWSEFALSEARRDLAGPLSPERRTLVASRLTEWASQVHEGLMAEVFETDEGERVAVLPRDDAALAPLAAALLDNAPEALRHGFVRARPPQRSARVFASVREETGVDLSHAVARAGFGRGHLLEIVVYSHEFGSAEDERALDAANLAVARLLGDARFDAWVAAVDVAPAPRPSSLRVLSVADSGRKEDERFALGDLASVVDRAVTGVLAGLPGNPYHAFCESAEWTMFELAPEPRADYPAQDDLALCVTMLPEMTRCFLENMRFSSERFSNHGERFVYLKVRAGGASSDARLELRTKLEEALNYVLVPGRVGCVVGAGLGLEYVYVNVALQNVEAGLELLRRTARKLSVPKRAWVLFFDSEWRNEWLGVWDDSPPPPGALL